MKQRERDLTLSIWCRSNYTQHKSLNSYKITHISSSPVWLLIFLIRILRSNIRCERVSLASLHTLYTETCTLGANRSIWVNHITRGLPLSLINRYVETKKNQINAPMPYSRASLEAIPSHQCVWSPQSVASDRHAAATSRLPPEWSHWAVICVRPVHTHTHTWTQSN